MIKKDVGAKRKHPHSCSHPFFQQSMNPFQCRLIQMPSSLCVCVMNLSSKPFRNHSNVFSLLFSSETKNGRLFLCGKKVLEKRMLKTTIKSHPSCLNALPRHKWSWKMKLMIERKKLE